MATDIKCPSCGSVFDVEEVIAHDLEEKLKKEYALKLQQSLSAVAEERNKLQHDQAIFEEKRKKENELFQQKLNVEKQKLEAEIQKQVTLSLTSEFEHKLRLLEQNNQDQEQRLKVARRKELEYLQREALLKNREEELELSVQRKLHEERGRLSEEIRKIEEQKVASKEESYQFRMRELEKQLNDQKILAEEMRRKAEQGSMQLQGETQELLLEEILRESFPVDSILEVGKGVEGADCIQVVRNHTGSEAGKIIFESKRAKSWNNVWIDKLKTDMRNEQADIAILVTQSFPKGMNCFGERDGVWICSFKEVAGLTSALRGAIIRIAETRRQEENKGEKMEMLYNYLTGLEFRQHIEAIVEAFIAMKQSITRERIQMEKLWKEREKQLDRVLLNTSRMYGSIRGIAGSSVNTIPLLEGQQVEEDDMVNQE